MSTTAVFVELLVIGTGTASWLLLFVAAVLRYRFDARLLQDNPALIGALTAAVYVLGIVVDRLVRDAFVATLEARAKRRVFGGERLAQVRAAAPGLDHANLAIELEKRIRAGSSTLAEKIDYNRSRLRICRAWAFHFFMIGLALVCWNARVGWLPPSSLAWLIGVDLVFLLSTLRATFLLAVDHHRDLLESFEILRMAANPTLAASTQPAPSRGLPKEP